MPRFSRAEILRRYRYLLDNAGDRTGVSRLFTNPRTRRPLTPAQLSDFMSSPNPPSWFITRLNNLYVETWSRRNLFEYEFEDWWMVVENEIARFGETLEAEGVETALEFTYRKLYDLGIKNVLTIRGFEYPVFGWMNFTGRLSDIKDDIQVFYFVGYRRSPYNVVVGHSVRMSEFIWNPDNLRITRERVPMVFELIASEVEGMLTVEQEKSMAASWYLIGFTPIKE